MAEHDEILQALRRLKLRLSAGEIDEATYDRLRERVVIDLSAEERAALGGSTPAPPSPSGAWARSPSPPSLGPSGGLGGGAHTTVARKSVVDFEPGAVLFGQWRLEREIGRGGFGVIFEATDLHLGQRQAVKVLDPGMVGSSALLSRFRREVLVLREVVHPRIVRVYDYREEQEESLALLSMELVFGTSLRDLRELARAEGVRIPVQQALTILAQVLEALAAAHSRGVIHRDVSPGNILLSGGTAHELLAEPGRDPRVKLIDFGIAGLIDRSELSERSRVLGTAAYVAPEVLDPATEVTPAVDVYSAGAVAYELLTGERATGRFEDPRRLREEISGEVDDLLQRLLARAPGQRPQAGAAGGRAFELSTSAPPERREPVPNPEPAPSDAAAEPSLEAMEPTTEDREAGVQQVLPVEATEPSEAAARERPESLRTILFVAVTGAVLLAAAAILTRRAGDSSRPIGALERSAGESPGAASDGSRDALQVAGDPEEEPSVERAAAPEAEGVAAVAPQGASPIVIAPTGAGSPSRAETASRQAPSVPAIRWRRIPAGTFRMGCAAEDPACAPDERPARSVELTRSFELAETETTVAQFRAFAQAASYVTTAERQGSGRVWDGSTWREQSGASWRAPGFEQGDEHPVVLVSWHDARAFCRAAGGRLPTEAEWERAARAGDDAALYPAGGSPGAAGANLRGEADRWPRTAPVGSFEPNRWGLYDLAGNAGEWVEDFHGEDAASDSPSRDPRGPVTGVRRVLRGGGWYSDLWSLRVSARSSAHPDSAMAGNGFRCARDVEPAPGAGAGR